MLFGHMPILISVNGSSPKSVHGLSFLASGEIWGHRQPAPTPEGLQTLFSLTPYDRGRNRPREGKRPGGSPSSLWSRSERW